MIGKEPRKMEQYQKNTRKAALSMQMYMCGCAMCCMGMRMWGGNRIRAVL